MTDYDLGRASGRIEIEHDRRGYRRAEEAQDGITNSANETSQAFSRAEDAAQDYERQQRRTTDTVQDGTAAEIEARRAREKATVAAEARRKAEEAYREVLEDSTKSEAENAEALRRRKKAVSEHLQAAKTAKKAEREFRDEIEGVTQALSALPDKQTTELDVDTKNADRKLRSFNERVQAARNAGKVLDKISGPEKMLGKAGALTAGGGAITGAGGLLGAGLSGMAVESIVGIVGSIGELSGLLGLLPGVAGSAALGVGTLKVATSGLGEAFEAILSGDSEAFAEALEEISKNAQDLMISFNALAPQIEDFKFAIQDVFTQDLSKWVQPVAGTYMPMLQKGMEGVASAMNWAIQDLAAWSLQAGVIEDIAGFFTNNTNAVNELSRAARPLADAFLDILSVSGDFLPQLAKDVREAAEQFSGWIQELRESGQLHEWIQTGIDAFKQLVDVVKNFGSGLARVFQIGQETGGGMLDFLQKIATAFNEWTNSAEGSNALSQFFTSMSQAADALMPVLKTLGTVIVGTLLPMLADFGTAMAPGLNAFFESLGTALSNLAPHLMSASGPLNQLLTVLGQGLVDVMAVIGPQLPTFMQQITDVVIALLPHLPAIAQAMIEFSNGMAKSLPGIADDIGEIMPYLIGFLGLIKSLQIGLLAGATQIIAWLFKLGSAFMGFMTNLISVWPNQAGQAMRGFFGTLWEQITGGLGVVKELFGNFFSTLGQQISGGWNVLLETLNGVKDKIWTWLSELPGKAFDAGKALIEDLMRGIRDRLGALGDIAKSVVETITDWLPGSPAKKGPLSGSGWTYKRGQSLSEDLAAGISSSSGDASKAAGGMAGEVSGALGMAQYGREGETSMSRMVNDLLQLSAFGQSLVDVFKRMSDHVFDIARLVTTDPTTGESIFPKEWKRTVSDDDLRRKREDREFQDSHRDVRDADTDSDGKPRRSGPAGRELATMGSIDADASSDEIAQAIIAEGQRRGLPEDAILSAISAGIVESGLRNLDYGDRDSLGVMQQRPSQGWGTEEQIMDPNYAIGKFYDALQDVEGFESMDPGELAQAVQNSGLPERYGEEMGRAREIYERLSGGAGSAESPFSSDNNKPTAEFLDKIKPFAGTYGLPGGTDTGGYGTGNADTFPDWVMALANRFGVKPSTYAGHQEDSRNEAGYAPNPEGENRGIDWSGPVENMQKLAEYLESIAADTPGLEQVIWRNPNTGEEIGVGGAGNLNDAYYPEGTYSGHENHVHSRQSAPIPVPGTFLDEFRPFVNAPGVPDGMVRGDDGRLQIADTADNTSKSVTLEEQILSELRGQSASLDQAISIGQDPNSTDEQIAQSLGLIDENIAGLKGQDTPVARAQIGALENVQSSIAGDRGFTQNQQDPIGVAQGIIGNVSSVAGDVFKVIDATLKSVASAAEISSTLVRGIENTADVNKIIDEFQSFLELGSAVAGAVSSIAGMAAGIAGASGGTDAGAASGALSAVSSIAGIVQGVYETINGVIDIGQEAYSIITKYVGRFLGDLLGGGEGSIMGDVRMLLDLNDNTLKAWSEDNPEDKRELNIPKWMQDQYGPRNETATRTPDLNLYIGPGTDPNDAMNAAMWELKTGGQGAFSYAGEF